MEPATQAPATPAQMFRVFQAMALQGFGGVLAVAQHELVERQRWLTREEFLSLFALGQVLPGPNIINMALLIGQRFHGWRGAMASVGGLLTMPLVIVIVLAASFGAASRHPAVAGALRGMGVVAAGLVVAMSLKLSGALRKSPLGWPTGATLAAGAFVAVGLMRWPLAWVVLAGGGLGVAAAWRNLRR